MKKIITFLFTSLILLAHSSKGQDISVGEILIGGNDDAKIMGQTVTVTVKLDAINGHDPGLTPIPFSVRIAGSGFQNFGLVTPSVDAATPAFTWSFDESTQTWTGNTEEPFGLFYSGTITFTDLLVGLAGTPEVKILVNLTPYLTDNVSINDSGEKSVPVNMPTPVNLISFDGKAEGNTAHLDWLTAEETGFSHFIVEKSLDAIQFSAVGQVSAKGSGNRYHFSTGQADPLVYYRLNMVDVDGSSARSKIIPVVLSDAQAAQVLVYPNPTTDYLHVKSNGSGTLQIVDISGNSLKSQAVEAGVNVLDVQALREGVYYGKINSYSFKFVKK